MLLLSTTVSGIECPFGEEDCDGKCGAFVDEEGDHICDHSLEAESQLEFESVESNLAETTQKQLFSKRIYNLLPISLVLLVAYLISHLLSKKKIISVVKHRMLWNFLLLITFIVSCFLGILLVIRINTGWSLTLPFNMLYWHVEAGIAMTIISIFHILWHLPYFKKMFSIKYLLNKK